MTSVDKMRAPDPRTDKTKEALLHASVTLAAQYGFDNITVRQIAKRADVNFAAVTYHFGSKDGLRDAAIDFVAEQMRLYGPGKVLRAAIGKDITTLSPAEAQAIIRKAMVTAISTANEPGILGDVPAFIHREVMQPGAGAKRFYQSVFSQELAVMCALVARVTGGEPTSEQTRLRALAIIGQSVFMSLARSLVHEAMGWDDYGNDELAALSDAFWVEP